MKHRKLNLIENEYKKVISILLCPPLKLKSEMPSKILHLKKINYGAMKGEYKKIKEAYKKEGIKVKEIDSKIIDKKDMYNIVYVRDTFFMTPQGAIISNMEKKIRKKEHIYIEKILNEINIPIIKKIKGRATFEGSDAIWINKKLVLVGVGNRTNNQGFNEVKKCLLKQKIKCIKINIEKNRIPQHLLGCLQMVDKDLALVRIKLVKGDLIEVLNKNNIKIIKVPENEEVKNRQAMNIVTISPRNIFMAFNCPNTKKIYLDNKINVIQELKISQLINGAGGLACATGILVREN